MGVLTMFGDDLRAWFDIFSGIVVYRPLPGGGHESDGWLNINDLEGRFKSEKLKFAGHSYDPENKEQRDKLLNSIITYASLFVRYKLLERRRRLEPPSLDYRVTPFGRRVGNWINRTGPKKRKRALFFLMALANHAHRYKAIITFGALGWAVANAVRFYGDALAWSEHLPFAALSAAVVSFFVGGFIIVKAMLGKNE